MMNDKRLLGMVLSAGLLLGATTVAPELRAQGKAKAGAVAAEAPTTKKPIAPAMAGVVWGMSSKQVAEQIDKVLDEDYRPLYKGVQPGVKEKELDAQLAEDKSQFRRSRIDFGKLPTGVDATPLKGEYTYNNAETMMTLHRKGATTYAFFIQDKLWKLIEEHKLSDTHPLGKTYPEAVVKSSTSYGVAGRVLTPDANRSAVEVDWKDSTTHLRIIQRGDAAAAIAYEDNATLSNLNALRPNKAVVDDGIDPAVAAIMHGSGSSDPGPKKDKKK